MKLRLKWILINKFILYFNDVKTFFNILCNIIQKIKQFFNYNEIKTNFFHLSLIMNWDFLDLYTIITISKKIYNFFNYSQFDIYYLKDILTVSIYNIF